MEKEKIIIDVLDELQPFFINDGGNIEFIKYEDNIVYVSFQGACAQCQMKDITLKEVIEKSIQEKLSEVKEVKFYSL